MERGLSKCSSWYYLKSYPKSEKANKVDSPIWLFYSMHYIISRNAVKNPHFLDTLYSDIWKSWVLAIFFFRESPYYVSVYMYFILKNYDIMFVKEIAHFVGISVPAISGFIGHKYFSFKNWINVQITFFWGINQIQVFQY